MHRGPKGANNPPLPPLLPEAGEQADDQCLSVGFDNDNDRSTWKNTACFDRIAAPKSRTSQGASPFSPPFMAENRSLSCRGFVKGVAATGAAFGLSIGAAVALRAEGKARSPCRPEVVAIYCPLWHRYDHMDAWHGYGWREWELLKSAPPRFPGHRQPLRPSWGFFDESDPEWSRREIDLAADHNIDVFLFDWYWYSGVRLMEETLENGFLKAPNRSRLKFALMWANHDWTDYFPAPYDKPRNIWLPLRHSPADLTRVIDYCIEHYFREANYWTVEGRLFLQHFYPRKPGSTSSAAPRRPSCCWRRWTASWRRPNCLPSIGTR